jgi:hypothetical protein
MTKTKTKSPTPGRKKTISFKIKDEDREAVTDAVKTLLKKKGYRFNGKQ